MADSYSEFDYIPLKASRDNKRKVTRKRNNLEVSLGKKYPPEGHCAVIRSSAGNEQFRILELGGARGQEEETWDEASSITEFIVTSDGKDVSITSVTSCKTTGGAIRPLHGGTLVDFDNKLVLWGGLDLRLYECRDDLIVIQEMQRWRTTIPHFDVTWVQTKDTLTPSRIGLDLKIQTGSIPSGRAGHSMTKIPGTNKAFLFGGYSINRNSRPDRWRKSCNDGRLYILDADSFEWETVRVPLIQARAFHTASIVERENNFILSIIGGMIFEGGTPTYREALSEVTIISMDKQLNKFTLSEISLLPASPDTHNIFVSSHASVVLNECILVVGGIQDSQREIIQDVPPKSSSKAFVLNLESNMYRILPKTSAAPSIFATYGHTLHKLLDDNTILVLGGSSCQISLLSNHTYESQECDFVPCTISESPDLADPTWIQCEKCNKWLHTFCIKLRKIREGRYFCKNCTR